MKNLSSIENIEVLVVAFLLLQLQYYCTIIQFVLLYIIYRSSYEIYCGIVEVVVFSFLIKIAITVQFLYIIYRSSYLSMQSTVV